MRKRSLFILGILVLVAGCNLETVRITGDPVYTLPAGTLEEDMKSYLGVTAIKDSLGAGFEGLTDNTLTEPNGIFTLKLDQSLLTLGLSDFFDTSVPLVSTISKDIPTPLTLDIPTINAGVTQTVSLPMGTPSGVPGTWPLPPTSQVVPLNAGTSFRQGVIGAGTFTLDLDAEAFGPGMTATVDLSVYQGGTLLFSGIYPEPVNVSLTGMTLTAEDLTINADITLTGTVSGGGTANLTANATVTQFQSMKINAPGMDLGSQMEYGIDAALQDLVASLTLDGASQLTVDLTNGLPVNMGVTVNSTPLGIVNDTRAYPGNQSTVQSETFDLSNKVINIDTLPTSLTYPDGYFPFDVTVTIPGYDPVTGDLDILTPVTVPASYTFDGSVTLAMNPASITITSPTPTSGTFPAPGEYMDLSGLNDFFPPEATFNAAPMKMVLTGLNSGLSGSVLVTGTYTDSNAVLQTIYLIDNGAGGPRAFTSGDADGAGNLEIPSTTFVDLINARPADLQLSYSFSVTSGVINLAGLPPAMEVRFVLDLPLQFNLSADAPLDFGYATPQDDPLNLEAKGEDLFGRKAFDADIDRILNQAKRIELNLDVQNTPIEGVMVRMTEADGFSKDFVLRPGIQTLALEPADIEYLRAYPFSPRTQIIMSQTDGDPGLPLPDYVQLKTSTMLTLKLTLTLETDIDYTYEMGGAK